VDGRDKPGHDGMASWEPDAATAGGLPEMQKARLTYS
jgi:hypothetical protein